MFDIEEVAKIKRVRSCGETLVPLDGSPGKVAG
jgi:hypothetical protein